MDKALILMEKMWQTLLSIVKIMLKSRRVTIQKPSQLGRDLVVLGNGPSLRPLIENHRDFLLDKDLLAVNYAVLSEYYIQLKPLYYLVADPLFFTDDNHCNRLFDAMALSTDWNMTLYVSMDARKSDKWKSKLASRPNIKVSYFNMTPVEGFDWFAHRCYKSGMGMPRPRNVLIPSIMTGLAMDYNVIYVAGADHSWLKEIWVNDDNIVMEDLNHFYDKKGAEQYVSTKHLHDLLLSMHIAFKSYHDIKRYASRLNKKIYNITKGSFIDAFERKILD